MHILKNITSFKKFLPFTLKEEDDTYIFQELSTGTLTITKKKLFKRILNDKDNSICEHIEDTISTKTINWKNLKNLDITGVGIIQKLIIEEKWTHLSIGSINQLFFRQKINLKYLKCWINVNEHFNLSQLLQIENLDIHLDTDTETESLFPGYLGLIKKDQIIQDMQISFYKPKQILYDILNTGLVIENLHFHSEITYCEIDSDLKDCLKKLGHNIQGITISHRDLENIDVFVFFNVLDYSKIIYDILGRTNLKMLKVCEYIMDNIVIDYRGLSDLESLTSTCFSSNSVLYGTKIAELELNTETIPKSFVGIRELNLSYQSKSKNSGRCFNEEPNNIQKLFLTEFKISLSQSYEHLSLIRTFARYVRNADPVYIKQLFLKNSEITCESKVYVDHLELRGRNKYCQNIIAKNITIWLDEYESYLNFNNTKLDTLTLKTEYYNPLMLRKKIVKNIESKVNLIKIDNGIELSDNVKKNTDLIIHFV